MGKVCLGALVICLFSATPGRGQPGQGEPESKDRAVVVLAEARGALGGAAALDAVRGLRATGLATRSTGALRVGSAIELLVAFPDRYLRLDRLTTGRTTSEVAIGFRGEALIQRATGPGGLRIDPTAGLSETARMVNATAAVPGVRQDLARLLLGFFCASPLIPLQFTYAGLAEAPEGTADVIDARGADGFEARLFVDTVTRLPRMVSWTGVDVVRLIQRLSSRTPGESTAPVEALMKRGELRAEHRLYFDDYRRVEGVRWPFRVRRAVGGEIVEEIVFDGFRLNPALESGLFDPDR